MPTPPQPSPESEKSATRVEAQRALGLYAPIDKHLCALAGVFVCMAMLTTMVFPYTVTGLLGAIIFLAFAVMSLLTWAIVLAYRILVFLLDLHADVALMPEASARIAVGFLQGRPAKK